MFKKHFGILPHLLVIVKEKVIWRLRSLKGDCDCERRRLKSCQRRRNVNVWQTAENLGMTFVSPTEPTVL